jgi:hypothetical protein
LGRNSLCFIYPRFSLDNFLANFVAIHIFFVKNKPGRVVALRSLQRKRISSLKLYSSVWRLSLAGSKLSMVFNPVLSENVMRTYLTIFIGDENHPGFHGISNMKIRSIFTFWEGFDFHGKIFLKKEEINIINNSK